MFICQLPQRLYTACITNQLAVLGGGRGGGGGRGLSPHVCQDERRLAGATVHTAQVAQVAALSTQTVGQSLGCTLGTTANP